MTTETTELFGAADPSLDDNYEIPGGTVNDDIFESLVGEDKKYKTAKDLAFAKLNADAHIKRIQDENKALRERMAQQAAIEDLLKNVNRNDAPIETSNPAHNSGDESGALSPDDLVAKVLSSLEERNRKAKETQNMELVKSTLPNALGRNWQVELKARLADTDLSEVEADRLARNNPKAFFRILGIDTTTSTQAQPEATNLFSQPAPKSQVNTMAQPQVNGERNKTYYDNIKKKMGIKAFAQDRDLQAQMHNDAIRLKDRFFT